MTYAAAASDILSNYAPFSWLAMGFVFALVAALVMMLHSKWAFYRSASEANLIIASAPKSVNPLASNFDTQRINIIDFFSPFNAHHVGKTFNNCDIVGPAVIALNACFISGMKPEFTNCNYVQIKHGRPLHLQSVVIFQGCTFINCCFYQCVICITNLSDIGVADEELILHEVKEG